MISSLLEKLNSMDYPDKNNIIEQVIKEQDLVKSYQIGYKKMHDFFCDNFRYYIEVFQFYQSKYYSGKYNEKKIFDIIFTIQELIRDNFFSSYNEYSLLRKNYKKSNEVILKIKENLNN